MTFVGRPQECNTNVSEMCNRMVVIKGIDDCNSDYICANHHYCCSCSYCSYPLYLISYCIYPTYSIYFYITTIHMQILCTLLLLHFWLDANCISLPQYLYSVQ